MIAVFLFAYRGYDKLESEPRWQPGDNLAANLAGLSAIGVAVFPVAQCGAPGIEVLIGKLHFFFASSLFLMPYEAVELLRP